MLMIKDKYKRLDWTFISLMIVFIHLIPLDLYASEKDSLAHQEIVKLIVDGAAYMNTAQYDSAIHLFEKADSLSIVHQSLKLQANCQYNLGVTYYRNGDYVKCGEYFDRALNMCQQTNDSLGLADYQLGIGILYKKKGDYQKATSYVLNAIGILENADKTQQIATAYNTLAGIQNKMLNDSLALRYYNQSLSLSQQINDSSRIATSLNNIGNYYLERNQFEPALNYLKSSFEIKKQIRDISSLSVTSNTIAELYLKVKKLDSAYYYLNLAYKYAQESLNSTKLVVTSHLKAKYFLEINKLDSALYFAELVRPIAIQNDLKDLLCQNYELSSILLEQKGDYKNSLVFARKYQRLNKEVLTADLAQNINDLQFQYESEKKDIEIVNLNEVNLLKTESIKTRNIGLWIISLFFVISMILMVLLYRAFQQKITANKKIRFLMHEKQHRTKNNLQLLSSVLSMQSLYSQQEDKDISLEVENRVQSIVLLDRLLYEANKEGDQIEISQYLNELIFGLSEAYEVKRKIEIVKNFTPLLIPAEQAKFIGLLVNEMITNSFKYAFRQNQNPKLEISFLPFEEKYHQLILRDNGPGLTENQGKQKTSSLGMKLIDTMSRQLKGKYQIENRNGFYFELVFEVKKGLN